VVFIQAKRQFYLYLIHNFKSFSAFEIHKVSHTQCLSYFCTPNKLTLLIGWSLILRDVWQVFAEQDNEKDRVLYSYSKFSENKRCLKQDGNFPHLHPT